MGTLFDFPNPVNEKTARTVAAIVLGLAVFTLVTQWWWLLPVLCAGFALRVASGPRFSPAGLLASRVIAPRLGEVVYTPGPPKRFAQAIGFVVTGVASIAYFGFGSELTAQVLTAVMILAAGLESILGLCIGCKVFAVLMRVGLIPASVCLACATNPER